MYCWKATDVAVDDVAEVVGTDELTWQHQGRPKCVLGGGGRRLVSWGSAYTEHCPWEVVYPVWAAVEPRT